MLGRKIVWVILPCPQMPSSLLPTDSIPIAKTVKNECNLLPVRFVYPVKVIKKNTFFVPLIFHRWNRLFILASSELGPPGLIKTAIQNTLDAFLYLAHPNKLFCNWIYTAWWKSKSSNFPSEKKINRSICRLEAFRKEPWMIIFIKAKSRQTLSK